MEQDIEYFAPLEPQDGMDAVERNMIGLHNSLAAVLDDYVEFVDDPQVQGVQSVEVLRGMLKAHLVAFLNASENMMMR